MTDEKNHAIANAKGWLENIQEMVSRLASDDGGVSGAAREEITQSALSVLVRDGWRFPGDTSEGAEEYEILLSTGGPALRIWGALIYGEADPSPRLEWQDWGAPWTAFRLTGDQVHDVWIFARCFYLSE